MDTIYNFTCTSEDNRNIVSYSYPDLYSCNVDYSVVSVTLDLSVIKGLYVDRHGISHKCEFNLDFDAHDLLKRLVDAVKSRNTECDSEILKSYPELRDVYDCFIIGLASYLVYCNWMGLSQGSLDYPFGLLVIPFERYWVTSLHCLDQNMFEYLGYASYVSTNIVYEHNKIGKYWFNQMTTFWNYWSDLFPSEIDLSDYTPKIIYHSLTSYASYLYSAVRKTSEAYVQIDTNLENACSYLENIAQCSVDELSKASRDSKSMFEDYVSKIKLLHANSIDEVKHQSKKGIGKINGLVKEIVDKLEITRYQVDSFKSKTIHDIDAVRLDLRREIDIATNAAVLEVDDTKEDLFTFVDEQITSMYSSLNEALDKIEEHGRNADQLGEVVAANVERKFREKIKAKVVEIVEQEVRGMKDEIKMYLEDKCEEHVDRQVRKIHEYCQPLIDKLEDSDVSVLKEEVRELKGILKQILEHLNLDVDPSFST